MKRYSRILVWAAVASGLLAANPAAAGGGGVAAYNTIYYSDGTHQNQVGVQYWSGCRVRNGNDEVIYYTSGTQTVYYTRELAGYCMDGEMIDP